MFTFLAFEVNVLIYPAFIVFLLMLIPIPILSKYISKFIAKVESIRVAGFSSLSAIAFMGVVLFGLALYDQREYIFSHSQKSIVKEGPLHMDYLSKKWRNERNMYIHAILAILYCSLLKMARLTLESDYLAKKAVVTSPKLASPAATSTSPTTTTPTTAGKKTAAPIPPTSAKKMD